ncbi:MAG: protein translocase SEC61 complex subunit gamma [archaeon]|nr:protein translocase SEC61 complex subunit gamma [archaeon]
MVISERISRALEYQGIESTFRGTGNEKYGRVLKMVRTPTSEEYYKIIVLTGVGIIALGALGFTIMLLTGLLVPST